jgi:predicted type IV restriction endonuclease
MEKISMQEEINDFKAKVVKLKDTLETEEATKTALIMPFFQVLGYDVFNPLEFIPEFTCDVGIKKGEKIDYAIKKNGKVIMVVEAKRVGYNLSKVDNQLMRYFHATDAKIAIMTDGVKYKFYSDLEKENIMDKDSFFEFNLEEVTEQQINDINKFKKENFNTTTILNLASDMRIVQQLKRKIYEEFNDPSPDFVKIMIDDIHEGTKTKQVIDYHKPFIKKAFNKIINDKVAAKLNSALLGVEDNEEEEIESSSKIITTEEEIFSYQVIKSILAEHIDIERVFYRDTETYFGILLDDNNRKWMCRIKFVKDGINVTFNDNLKPVKIQKIDELYKLKEQLLDSLKRAESKGKQPMTP